MGERQQPLAGGDLVEQGALLFGSGLGDQRTGPERGVQHRFGRQPPADLGEYDENLDLPAGVLVESETENTHLGELLPDVAAPSEFGIEGLEPTFGVVLTRQHVPGGVAEQDLLFTELKIHVLAHNPRMVDAMMVRWTSLLPP